MRMIRIATLLSLLLVSLALPASPPPARAAGCLPQVRDGWIRMPPMNLPMMAGYARIENRCAQPATIVSADSAAFADASLHETRIERGISRMRATAALRIPAGGSVVLHPGGSHLMLMQPRTPLKAGGKVAIDFLLQDGRKLRGEFEVRAAVR
jgi:copper(I)-binding protein